MFPTGTSGKPGVRSKVAESLAMSGDLGLNGRTEVGYADSGGTARFFHHFPLEVDPIFYSGKAGKLDRAGSKHPTVKPIALMRYLIRHVTPPGGVILDPFAGSGTTGVAALDEGFDCILMEAEVEYAEFLRNRFELQNSSKMTSKSRAPVHLDNGATSDFIDLLGDDFFDLTA
jgi:site-specific DNA-methyltransferase (adenine-specific)